MFNKNQNGFIPMIILLLIVIAVVIWFAYHRVSGAHKQTLTNTLQQNESR